MKTIMTTLFLLFALPAFAHHEYSCEAFGAPGGGAKKLTIELLDDGGAVVSNFESLEGDCNSGYICSFGSTLMEGGDVFTTHLEVKQFTSYYSYQYDRGHRLEGNKFLSFESGDNNTEMMPDFDVYVNRLVISNPDHALDHQFTAYFEIAYQRGIPVPSTTENMFNCELMDHDTN